MNVQIFSGIFFEGKGFLCIFAVFRCQRAICAGAGTLYAIMKFRFLHFLFSLFGLFTLSALTGCGKDNPVPVPPPVPEEGSRTVMVYMVANNNLGSADFDADDLEEMRKAVVAGALGPKGHLLVFHEAYGASPVLKAFETDGSLIELKAYDSGSTGVEARTMAEALDDMKAYAIAESYGLILWSHASGWIEDGIREDTEDIAPLSFGLSGRRKMNVSTLARVLEGRGLDFVYFDCCYMMGIETVYQLRRAAPVLAGSPTELPSAGMPYDRTLPFFFAEGEPDLPGAARTTFEHYDGQSGSARTSTMSVVRTAGLEALAQACLPIYGNSLIGMPGAPFEPQRYTATGVETCKYFDFGQYMRELAKDSPERLAAFEKALGDVVVYENATPYLWSSVALKEHSGLSTYIMRGEDDPNCQLLEGLDWSRIEIFPLPDNN